MVTPERGGVGDPPAPAAPLRLRCLTEASVGALVAGAIGFSAVLWLAVLAVL